MDIAANPRDYVIIANEVSLTVEANPRDLSLVANEFDVNESQVTYTVEYERVTSFGDTRTIDTGDTRIVYGDETGNPYEVIANKRNYTIIAPEVNNG